MPKQRVFNPSDRPVVVDDAGRVVGGGEWADIDTSSDLVTDLLAREQLLIPDGKPVTTKTKE